MTQYNESFKWKFYTVQVGPLSFYLLDKGDEYPIKELWQTLEQAKAQLGSPYAIVMANDEVIQYGQSLGFIKKKNQLSQNLIKGKKKKAKRYVKDDTSEAERLTCK